MGKGEEEGVSMSRFKGQSQGKSAGVRLTQAPGAFSIVTGEGTDCVGTGSTVAVVMGVCEVHF